MRIPLHRRNVFGEVFYFLAKLLP